MCFCRRKNNDKDDVESSKRGEPVKKARDQQLQQQQQQQQQQQMMAPAAGGVGVPLIPIGSNEGAAPPMEKQPRPPKHFGRSRKSKRRPSDEDTITNIPDEMPDLEVNREHPEPFYTDEQLM